MQFVLLLHATISSFFLFFSLMLQLHSVSAFHCISTPSFFFFVFCVVLVALKTAACPSFPQRERERKKGLEASVKGRAGTFFFLSWIQEVVYSARRSPRKLIHVGPQIMASLCDFSHTMNCSSALHLLSPILCASCFVSLFFLSPPFLSINMISIPHNTGSACDEPE